MLQAVQNLRDIFSLIDLFGLKKKSENPPLKCKIYFSPLYHNFKIALQHIVHFSEQFWNNNNEVSLFNVVASNIALLDVSLF